MSSDEQQPLSSVKYYGEKTRAVIKTNTEIPPCAVLGSRPPDVIHNTADRGIDEE